MHKTGIIFLGVFLFVGSFLYGQDSAKELPRLNGQLALWTGYAHDAQTPLTFGQRYIPRLKYRIPLKENHLIDFEASANLVGNLGIAPGDTFFANAAVTPYRMWGRYSNNRLEIRAGLQKISFGSAVMLRPLMWFDQIDPRDPLRITNGVYGVLGRYFFQNNANLWVWGLTGNQHLKGWDFLASQNRTIEGGGRVQLPLKRGEIAGSYHFRMANADPFLGPLSQGTPIPENRIGLDGKFDFKAGVWFEASWTHLGQDLGNGTNQTLLNIGTDYTFPVGNGLNVVLEQLVVSGDRTPFAFSQPSTISATSIAYPLGMFDNLSTIVYYDWNSKNLFAFLNWKRSFDLFTLNVLAFWNPTANAPAAGNQLSNFGGKGAQGLWIFNH